MYSKKFKKDGNPNQVYERILGYRDQFTSAAVVEDISQASRVVFAGNNCQITENMWVPKGSNSVASSFRISSNFINPARQTAESQDQARFEFSGVVLNKRPELDKEEQETGRLLIDMGIIGWQGRIDVVTLVATDTKRTHVEANWEKGDTVTAIGIINMTQEIQKWKEEVGFGEPIERQRTISKRELLLTAGSACGNEDALSYDAGDVKVALAERKARQDKLIEDSKNSAPKPAAKTSNDFGF